MGSMSLMHCLVILIMYLIVGIPVARILRRVGFSGWCGVLTIIPLANLWTLGSGFCRLAYRARRVSRSRGGIASTS